MLMLIASLAKGRGAERVILSSMANRPLGCLLFVDKSVSNERIPAQLPVQNEV